MNDLLLQSALRAHQAGNRAEAARLCRELLRAEPKNFNALSLLAFVQFQNGQFEEAERLIGEAIRINPRSLEALYSRGCVLQNLHRQEEALVCFDQALALNPEPVVLSEEIVRFTPPELLSVCTMICEAPMRTLPKLRLAGLSASWLGIAPTPDNVTVSVLCDVLSP